MHDTHGYDEQNCLLSVQSTMRGVRGDDGEPLEESLLRYDAWRRERCMRGV